MRRGRAARRACRETAKCARADPTRRPPMRARRLIVRSKGPSLIRVLRKSAFRATDANLAWRALPVSQAVPARGCITPALTFESPPN